MIAAFCLKNLNYLYSSPHNYLVLILLQNQEAVAYCSILWPSAPILALYLWEHRSELRGKYILELGSGTALPGILAAKCGAFVTLSESALLPRSVDNLKRTCELNELNPGEVAVIGLTWGLFTGSVLRLKPLDLIIASDCFYDPSVFEDILATVSFLIDRNPNTEFLTTYQERSSDWSIEPLLHKWKLTCSTVGIDNLGVQSGIDINDLVGNHSIHLLKIFRNF